ncbi:MAG TPA: cysteine synthase family protein [Candidatus Kapabacteria bacterium]|nr:cysteine synthase family protein [Candidatus Kapabacteria bacterium]
MRPQETASAVETMIGNTPLVELRNVRDGLADGVRVFGKAEWMNPGGSVKDRAALAMIRRGEERGLLRPGMTLIDATSGNTGIAYAMLCAAKGYRCTLVIPANASHERRRMLSILGADLVLTDPLEGGTDEAQRVARLMAEAEPERYFYPDQYGNDANWRAHYQTTGLEIWRQTCGMATHFIAGLGTTGTFVGTSRRLKELNPDIVCISFQPDTPLHGLEGMKHLETARVPAIYDPSLADAREIVGTDQAYAMARRLAREEGLFVGISAAAAAVVALRVGARLHHGMVVTIFPDGGTRYMSDRFWEERSAPAATHAPKTPTLIQRHSHG